MKKIITIENPKDLNTACSILSTLGYENDPSWDSDLVYDWCFTPNGCDSEIIVFDESTMIAKHYDDSDFDKSEFEVISLRELREIFNNSKGEKSAIEFGVYQMAIVDKDFVIIDGIKLKPLEFEKIYHAYRAYLK